MERGEEEDREPQVRTGESDALHRSPTFEGRVHSGSYPELKRVNFTHDALIDWMIANPDRYLRDAALYFGYTSAWLSIIVNSDVFQAKLAERQAKVASMIDQTVMEKLTGATHLALDGLTRKLETADDAKFLLDATDKLLHKMGFAPKSAAIPTVNNTNTINNITVSSADLSEARALMLGKVVESVPPADRGLELLPPEAEV